MLCWHAAAAGKDPIFISTPPKLPLFTVPWALRPGIFGRKRFVCFIPPALYFPRALFVHPLCYWICAAISAPLCDKISKGARCRILLYLRKKQTRSLSCGVNRGRVGVSDLWMLITCIKYQVKACTDVYLGIFPNLFMGESKWYFYSGSRKQTVPVFLNFMCRKQGHALVTS